MTFSRDIRAALPDVDTAVEYLRMHRASVMFLAVDSSGVPHWFVDGVHMTSNELLVFARQKLEE